MQQPDETSGKFKVTSDSILILKGKFGEARCELRNSTAAKSEACGAMQREEDFGSAASSRLRIYSKLWFHGTSGLRGRITRVLNENGFWQSSTGNAARSIQMTPDGTCKSFSKFLPQVENCGRRRRNTGAVKNAR